jgi:hypothetical protein
LRAIHDWVARLPEIRLRNHAHAAILFSPDAVWVLTEDPLTPLLFALDSEYRSEEASTLFEALRAPDELPDATAESEAPSAPTEERISAPEKSDLRRLYEALDASGTPSEKGTALEQLAKALLNRVRGLTVVEHKLRTASSEIDLVVEVSQSDLSSIFREFGRYALVECRNWRDPVRAKDIRDFVGKLTKTKTRLGILFARNGITGLSDSSDALREIQAAYDARGLHILVVTDEDLRAHLDGAEFVTMLDQKLFSLRFDA